MAFRIGFAVEDAAFSGSGEIQPAPKTEAGARRSVVQVHFPARHMTLAYYNDRFDLHCGDTVYVDGKLEGLPGRVVEVSYNFRIKLSDYKRVIAVADSDVKGEFFIAGSHFISFDPHALPRRKAATWFIPPAGEDDEYVSSRDDSAFPLDSLKDMGISMAAAERGYEYYNANKVRYLCLDGSCGYAIVEGSKNYELEFELRDGMISGLSCGCYCSGNCKHGFAAMLQLKETLEFIHRHYPEKFMGEKYFAAIDRELLLRFAVENRESGKITI